MQQVAIHTPQNVAINFVVAELGRRMIAKFIDLAIVILLYIGLSYVLTRTVLSNVYFEDSWSYIAVFQLFMLPATTYSLWIEVLTHGKSIGKMVMKLQIMRLDGRVYGWENAIIRWMCNIIDSLPFGYILGLIVISSTKKGQRIGDLAAGTVVIDKKKQVGINQTILVNLKEDYQPTYSQVLRLSDNDMRIIKDTFLNAAKAGDTAKIRKLRHKIEEVTGITNPELNDVNFIKLVMRDFNYYTNK
jgi:uncharacterized RDD family membrane protein YckC